MEGALRLLQPTPCPGAATSERMACLHTYSEVYGWALRPGVRLPIAGGHITVNAEGRRGAERGRSPSRPRLVSLGDSVAFGLDVDDEATLAAQLRRLEPSLDVFDLSVPGYGTDQELIKLEREGLGLEPHVVVLNFTVANDLVDNALDTFLYDGVHPKPYFRLEADALRRHDAHLRLGPSARAAVWLSERSLLFNRLAPARARPAETSRAEGDGAVHWQTRYNEALARPEPLVALAARLLEEMAERARGAGASLVVVAHPSRRSFVEGAPPWLDALRRRLGPRGVSLVDLAERYRARGLGLSELATDGLGHLNAEGHRAAAEAIRDALEERRAAFRPSPSSPPLPE
ncbi:MAG TPA: GDSL-type esterase/lipase family protein [Vicinamibacteria bacterium]|nr:GDSL-type esterase/lipase family protein [Vicinamibacteria bacterium]